MQPSHPESRLSNSSLVGLLLGWMLVGDVQQDASSEAGRTHSMHLRTGVGMRVDQMNLRQLRALPGLGHGRAGSILQERESALVRGVAPDWLETMGIGPKTKHKVQAWLKRNQELLLDHDGARFPRK